MISSLLLIAASAGLVPLPKSAPAPADNPSTPAKIELGRRLFFDHRISKTGMHSCASCHGIAGGGSGENNQPFSIVPAGKPSRHAVPTVWNSGFLAAYFWGGGAKSLEEQAEGPLEEMGLGDAEEVVRKIQTIPGYAARFKQAFPEAVPTITLKTLTQAIAAFERTLNTPRSSFDRFLQGDGKALDASARRGLRLFSTIGCTTCHSGPAFSSEKLKPFPIHADNAYVTRYGLASEPRPDGWRVPPLRNIALTAPYFHNGSVTTLDQAVRVMAKTQLDRDLKQSETDDLVAFLRSLTGEIPRVELPDLSQD